MTIVDTIERVTAFVQANICDGYQLKQPDEKHSGSDYRYKLVNPTAYPVYIPTEDRLPAGIATVYPAILVRLIEGAENAKDHSGQIKIMLNFIIWNPGEHAEDFYTPDGDTYHQGGGPEFKRSMNGWRELWSFIDRGKRILTNAEYIDGARIMLEKGLEFGPVNADDTSNRELYPFWAAWLTFYIETPPVTARAAIEDYL